MNKITRRIVYDKNNATPAGTAEIVFRFSTRAIGAWLGISFFLFILILDVLGFIADNDRRILLLATVYLLWVVLPLCACLSAAMYNCLPNNKNLTVFADLYQACKVIFNKFMVALFPVGAVFLGVLWRDTHMGKSLPPGYLATSLLTLSVSILAMSAWAWIGLRMAVYAHRSGNRGVTRFLQWCWSKCDSR